MWKCGNVKYESNRNVNSGLVTCWSVQKINPPSHSHLHHIPPQPNNLCWLLEDELGKAWVFRRGTVCIHMSYSLNSLKGFIWGIIYG